MQIELPDLRRMPRIALRRETRGLNWAHKDGHTVGLGIAWDGGSLYVSVRHPDTDNFDPAILRQWEIDHIRAGVPMIYHKAHFDIGWATAEGAPLPDGANIDDTLGMAVFVDETQPEFTLEAVCKRHGIEPAPCLARADIFRMPARAVSATIEMEARAVLALHHILRATLDAEGTYEAYRLEMDILPLVVEMQRRGVRVDTGAAERNKELLLARRDDALKELSDKLGCRIGMMDIAKNSWKERIFIQEGVKFPRTEPTAGKPDGFPSFTSGAKGWMHKDPHWLPQLIVRAQRADTDANQFLQTYIIDNAHRGRIHPEINQFLGEDAAGVLRGAKTTRFSYSGPPLQQMQKRDEFRAEMTRGVFLAEPNEYWMAEDYRQQEFRLIVDFAERLDLHMAQVAADMYRRDPDTDFHNLVASLTGLPRGQAKNVSFAKSYNAGPDLLAIMINCTLPEAVAIMAQYDEKMPFVRELNNVYRRLAERNGWIELIDGARAHFGPGNPTKDAMNRRVQGSAARQIKTAMKQCWREGIVPLIQLHDELGFSVSSDDTGRRVAEIMKGAIPDLRVPMEVDCEYGTTWGNATKVEDSAGVVVYGASFGEAQRLRAEGKWWKEAA